MKKNILKGVFSLAFAVVAGYSVYTSQQKVEMSDLAMANVEALATGEEIEGLVCFYKGNEHFEKRIPCTADYPNIGPCGEPESAFYSGNRAQCAK